MPLHHKYIKNDKPILVMLHGLISSLETFTPIVPILEKYFSLLIVDQRGHGKSPPEGTDYSADAMALDLKNLLDELQIKKASILGHSMGGRTALMFGQLFPEMVEKMIIEDMGIDKRREDSDSVKKEKMELAKRVTVSSLHFKDKEEIFTLISPLFSYARDLLKTKVIVHENSFELIFWPHVSVMYGHQGNSTDLTETLTTTVFPVLFILADLKFGSVMTEASIEHIKKYVPRAKIMMISKAGHTVHKTHPDEFCEAVIDFIQDKK